MTRLEQALRWWNNHDEALIPRRHLAVLRRAGYLCEDADDLHAGLTQEGESAACALVEAGEGEGSR